MKLSSSKIYNEIRRFSKPQVICLDNYYWVWSYEEMKRLVSDSFIERYKYVSEMYDCDDFAVTLMAYSRQERHRLMREGKITSGKAYAYPMGICIADKNDSNVSHAFNVTYTRDNGLYFIEPQTDEVYKQYPFYTPRVVMI